MSVVVPHKVRVFVFGDASRGYRYHITSFCAWILTLGSTCILILQQHRTDIAYYNNPGPPRPRRRRPPLRAVGPRRRGLHRQPCQCQSRQCGRCFACQRKRAPDLPNTHPHLAKTTTPGGWAIRQHGHGALHHPHAREPEPEPEPRPRCLFRVQLGASAGYGHPARDAALPPRE
ncbi:hypothetical protein C8F04DRAFT_1140386 [Mycena alexandri]|uniref:Uncharacterized protein n=1 Tax=Mycena alexandri TaxID=1745969 RepID=A0AAD6S5K1_9AGAR|nr:hypothetical protein C8F04DRAFT_1140386 [Mycena alexandri]